MSRRKDREQFSDRKLLNPDYHGFRGYDQEPGRVGNTPRQMVTCSICGRRRNVAVGIAQGEGEDYVCLTCREEGGGLPVEKGPVMKSLVIRTR